MKSISLDAIIKSWQLSPEYNEFYPGATEEQIQSVEVVLGRSFPEDFKQLYKFTNGAHLLQGNLGLYPLDGNELSVAKGTTSHQQWNWPMPDEVVIFGDNGQGDLFGLWLPNSESAKPAIIEVGGIFESGSMTIAGSSLVPFLLGYSAFYLLLIEANPASIDLLSIPKEIQHDNPDYNEIEDFVKWADPERPGVNVDVYEARLDVESIRKILQSSS